MELENKTIEERLTKIEEAVMLIMEVVNKSSKVKKDFGDLPLTKEGIPVGIRLIGITRTKPLPIILQVKADGYYVGRNKYNSLSSAAEAVSDIRRSGWSFWHVIENDKVGMTIKEFLGK